MNKLTISILTLLTPLFAATVDRSKAPEPGPAPEIRMGAYQQFELDNGLKVFVVENHKLPVLSLSLQLDRDPILEGSKKGYVEATGELLMRGTVNRTKLQLDEEIDFLGARIQATSDSLFARSLSKHRESLFELVADIILNPAFSEEELAKVKKQTEAGLQSMKDNPDQILNRVRDASLYGKEHPYGELLTEETLKSYTIDDCKAYYEAYFRPNIGYLSIVGDITVEEAKQLVEKHLGSWKKAEVPSHSYDVPVNPKKTQVVIVHKEGAVQTALALGNLASYRIKDENYFSARLMNAILGGGGGRRLYNNLREEKGLTYGAYSRLSQDRLIGSFSATAKVRNEVTKEAVDAFRDEFAKIRAEVVPADELKDVKAYVAGGFIRSLEQPQTVSRFAITTAIHELPQDFYQNYLKSLEKVTQEEIQKAAANYVPAENGYIFAVGDKETLKKALASYGDIHILDVNADPVKTTPKIPEGMTAAKVIEGYIKAIGGAEKLKKVHASSSQGNFNMMGMVMPYRDYRVEPDKYAMVIEMNGQVMMKQVLNGDKAMAIQMGQKQMLGEKEAAKMKRNAIHFSELLWGNEEVSTTLKGMQDLEGTVNYAIAVEYANGDTQTHFYNAETFLKTKVTSSIDTPQGPMAQSVQILEYKDVDGIQYPVKIQIKSGPQVMDLSLDTVSFNPELDETIFSVE